MIPSKSQAAVSGHIPGRSTKMTLDPRATAQLISMFTDMYSNVELAVVRELACNARDSHVQAGKADVPIRVSTPGPLSPYLVIEDEGLGLSVDELHDLYSKYGASTKRDSNEVTGMLGIGSKSPLAYTGQFTLTAIHDGTRATVSISRDEDGVGNLTVVDTSSTDEPNGVSIKIPAKTGNSFAKEAKDFFRYWKPGTVLLDGKDPSGIEGMEITPTIALVKGNRYASTTASKVVMGNVPYPTGDELSPQILGLPYGYYIVAEVPLGDVEIAPSREALTFDARTRARLNLIRAEFKAGLVTAVQAAVQKSPTAFEALKTINSYAQVLGRNQPDSWSWRGRELPTRFRPPTRQLSPTGAPVVDQPVGRIIVINRHDRGKHGQSKMLAIDLTIVTEAVFVLDYDRPAFTPTHRKKLEQWLQKQSDELKAFHRVVLVDWPLPGGIIPASRTVKWATLAAEVLPREDRSGSTGRIKGSFDLAAGQDNAFASHHGLTARYKQGVPGDQIDQGSPVFWMHGNIREFRPLQAILDAFHKKFTVVLLPENRIAKFKRENPHVKEVRAEVLRLYKTLTDKLTDAQKLRIWMDDNGCLAEFRALHPHRRQVLDPVLKKCLDACSVDISAFVTARKVFRHEVEWENDAKHTDPLDKYPLFDLHRMQRVGSEHVLRYLNAEYAHLKRNP